MNESAVVMAYNNLAVIYSKREEWNEAIELISQALAKNIISGCKESMAENYVNLGIIYLSIDKIDHAIDSFNKALKIDKSINNKRGMADDYSNLGSSLQNKRKTKQGS